jgi:hypothetical protein
MFIETLMSIIFLTHCLKVCKKSEKYRNMKNWKEILLYCIMESNKWTEAGSLKEVISIVFLLRNIL